MFTTILVPLDGSKRAEKILPYVEALAYARECKLILLRVIEPPSYRVSPYDSGFYYSPEMIAADIQDAEAALQKKAEELRSKEIEAVPLVKQGLVVQQILAVAAEGKADLIAMASHGRTGLSRVFYGSVAAGVLNQADRPLLLIRSLDLPQAASEDQEFVTEKESHHENASSRA
jgi:nucleotide-binding universal stress UspA family protein